MIELPHWFWAPHWGFLKHRMNTKHIKIHAGTHSKKFRTNMWDAFFPEHVGFYFSRLPCHSLVSGCMYVLLAVLYKPGAGFNTF